MPLLFVIFGVDTVFVHFPVKGAQGHGEGSGGLLCVAAAGLQGIDDPLGFLQVGPGVRGSGICWRSGWKGCLLYTSRCD